MPDHSARALAVLRVIAGGGDFQEAVAGNLLRLGEERRAAFDRVLKLQNVPALNGKQDPATVAATLSGLVYASSLDPDGLLVNADSHLLSKHLFVPDKDKRASVFSPAALMPSPSGSHLVGGFANLAELGKGFAPAGRSSARSVGLASPAVEPGPASPAPEGSAQVHAELPPVESDFKVSGRLVEVPVTVTDSRGRYVDNLTRDEFTILDQRSAQSITAFEPQSKEVSVVLLLDTTGSMLFALPALKNAALRLIAELRPEDSATVYSFSDSVTELQPFTTDKAPPSEPCCGLRPVEIRRSSTPWRAWARISSGGPGRR